MIFVLTESYQSYRKYLIESGLTPKQAKYIHSEEQVFGYDPEQTEVHFYGRWWLNPLWENDPNRDGYFWRWYIASNAAHSSLR